MKSWLLASAMASTLVVGMAQENARIWKPAGLSFHP